MMKSAVTMDGEQNRAEHDRCGQERQQMWDDGDQQRDRARNRYGAQHEMMMRVMGVVAEMFVKTLPHIVFKATFPFGPFRVPRRVVASPLAFTFLPLGFRLRCFVDGKILADAYSDFAHGLTSVELAQREIISM
jgi:hypothetical protein